MSSFSPSSSSSSLSRAREPGRRRRQWCPVLRLGGRVALTSLFARHTHEERAGGDGRGRRRRSSDGAEEEEEKEEVDRTRRHHSFESSESSSSFSTSSSPCCPKDEGEESRARELLKKRKIFSGGESRIRPRSSCNCLSSPSCRRYCSPSSSASAWCPPSSSRSLDVVRCRFSPNGCFLGVCTAQGALRVYDVETGRLICAYPYAHTKGINDICWHSSSAYIYTASSDSSSALFPLHFRSSRSASSSSFSVRSPPPLVRFSLHSSSFSKASPLLHLGPAPSSFPDSSKNLKRNSSVSQAPSSAASSAISSSSSSLSSSASSPLASIASPITSVTAHTNGSYAGCLYTGGYDEVIRLWDVRGTSSRPLVQVKAHDCPITSLDYSPPSPLLLPPFCPSSSSFFSGSLCCPLVSTSSSLFSSSSSSPGIVVSASLDGLVRFWEGNSLRLLKTLRGGSSGDLEVLPQEKRKKDQGRQKNREEASEDDEEEEERDRRAGGGGGGGEGGSSGNARGIACSHVCWSRSGNFLLCTYENGKGGRLFRINRHSYKAYRHTDKKISSSPSSLQRRRNGGRTRLIEEEEEEGSERYSTRKKPREDLGRLRARASLFHRVCGEDEYGPSSSTRDDDPGGSGEEDGDEDGQDEEEEEEEGDESEEEEEEELSWGRELTMPLQLPVSLLNGSLSYRRAEEEAFQAMASALYRFSGVATRLPPPLPLSVEAARQRGGTRETARKEETQRHEDIPRKDEQTREAKGDHREKQKGEGGEGDLRAEKEEANDAGGSDPEGKSCKKAFSSSSSASSSSSSSRSSSSSFSSSSSSFFLPFCSSCTCPPRRTFSPFGCIWRDFAFVPMRDGRVWVFDAMRGNFLESLSAPVDLSCCCQGASLPRLAGPGRGKGWMAPACRGDEGWRTRSSGGYCTGRAVCTSVDAHPDWSIGVLATSFSSPDSSVLLWLLWRSQEEDDLEGV